MYDEESTSLRSQRLAQLQLYGIMQKNWTLTCRNRRDAAREFGLPIILLVVLVALARVSHIVSGPAVIDSDPVPVPPYFIVARAAGVSSLWVAPCADPGALGWLASNVSAALSNSTGLTVTCFPCESVAECGSASLIAAYGASPSAVIGAVVFDTVLPAVSYRIRLDAAVWATGLGSTNVTPMFESDGSPAPPDRTPAQYGRAILPLQWAVDEAIVTVATGGTGNAPRISALAIKEFPSPAYAVDVIGPTLLAVVPIYMTLIYTMMIRVLLARILEEKERRIKIALRMNGLPPSLDLAAWTITALVKNTLIVTVIVIVACLGGVFKYSSMGVVWVFYFLFELASIAYCFMISALFSRSKTGTAVGTIVYMLAAAPTYALTLNGVPVALKIVLGVLSPVAFSLGNSVLVLAEQRKVRGGCGNSSSSSSSSI